MEVYGIVEQVPCLTHVEHIVAYILKDSKGWPDRADIRRHIKQILSATMSNSCMSFTWIHCL